jgi:very-short-patch-repair endonuclease
LDLKVVRFQNDEVLHDLARVAENIAFVCLGAIHPSPAAKAAPSPKGEG